MNKKQNDALLKSVKDAKSFEVAGSIDNLQDAMGAIAQASRGLFVITGESQPRPSKKTKGIFYSGGVKVGFLPDGKDGAGDVQTYIVETNSLASIGLATLDSRKTAMEVGTVFAGELYPDEITVPATGKAPERKFKITRARNLSRESAPTA